VFDAQVQAPRVAAPVAAASEPAPAPAAPRKDAGALVFLDLSGATMEDESDEEPAASEPAAEVALDLDLATSAAPAWDAPVAVDGFEGTSWADAGTDGQTIGLSLELPAELPVPSTARPALVHASALPGELAMLELPIAAAATPATLELDATPELTFLPVEAPAEPEAPSLVLLDVEEMTELEPVVEAPPAAPPVAAGAAPAAPVVAAPPARPTAPVPAPAPSEEYVDLGDWLRETDAPRSTRMVTAEPSQTGDEEADFQRMLDAFKAGVERNIEDVDFDSHFDLGVAFREMGLLEEAATQFQRASRAPGRPLRAIEALGECFIDLGHAELALEALRRGIEDGPADAAPLPDQQLVGVIYLLGVASEQTQRSQEACAYYRRVLATDLQFRDAARRLAQLSAPPR
jgi:hypothetical protein